MKNAFFVFNLIFSLSLISMEAPELVFGESAVHDIDEDYFSTLMKKYETKNSPDIIDIARDNFDDLVRELQARNARREKLCLAIGRGNDQEARADGCTWVHLDKDIFNHTPNQLYVQADFNTQRFSLKKLPPLFSRIAFDVRVIFYADKPYDDLIEILSTKLKDSSSVMQLEFADWKPSTVVEAEEHQIENCYPFCVKLSSQMIETLLPKALSDKAYLDPREDEIVWKEETTEEMVRRRITEDVTRSFFTARVELATSLLLKLFADVTFHPGKDYYESELPKTSFSPYLTNFFVATSRR